MPRPGQAFSGVIGKGPRAPVPSVGAIQSRRPHYGPGEGPSVDCVLNQGFLDTFAKRAAARP
jgi:hypothetical protein